MSDPNIALLAEQISKYEGYAKSARAALKEIRKEAEADSDDGPRIKEAAERLSAARETYKEVLRGSKAAVGQGESGARIESEESTIRESKEAIRDLKRKAKEQGVNLKSLSIALALKRLDPDVRADTFDKVDVYAAAMKLWYGDGA